MDQMAMLMASVLNVNQARRARPLDALAWAARSSPTYDTKVATRIESATARRLYWPVSRVNSGSIMAPLPRVGVVEGTTRPSPDKRLSLGCQARSSEDPVRVEPAKSHSWCSEKPR